MKVRIGRSRSRADAKRSSTRSPLELALGPAFSEGEWDVPGRFNFTRDVIDVLARDTKRRALMHLGRDGIIEPRTFHQIAESTSRWAALLGEKGLSPQDRLVVVSGATPDWVEVVLAGIKVGAVTVPCPESISAGELDARVQSSDAKLIVASRNVEGVVASLDPRPEVVYMDERPGGRASDPVPDVTAADTSPRDAAFILSTAGTSGVPRGVVHTHGAAFASRVQAEHWLDAGQGDAVWCTADTGNALAVWAMLGTWSRGAEVILHADAFEPEERLDLIDRLGTTILCQTPAEYAALTELRAFRRYRPQRLRRLVSTGDTLPRDVIATYEEVWGMTIHEGYGQVETGVVVANGIDTGFRSGSVGLPIAGYEVAVIDDQGNVLEPDVEGELAVRGRPASLFQEYWGDPEETKAAFRGDWFTTGDIARTDEDGFILLAGRADDMITSRGRRFGPFEIEHALRSHEAVVDSAAVGIRDLERGGQFIRAFVVLRPGVAASEQLEAQLRGFVESALPEYAVPREIEFLEELPRTPSGNIRRAVLREQQVAGRPLWETTPTTEPEPLLPSPEPEPMPPAEPAGFVVQEYFPHIPDSAPTQEPAWTLPPEPLAYLEPAPGPVVPVEPEPVAYVDPEPEPYVEPEPQAAPYVEPEPQPVPYVEPEAEPVPEAVAYVEPEAAPEPAADVEPPLDSTVTEPPPVLEPEPTSAIEAPPEAPPPEQPVAFQEPLPREEPVAASEPATLEEPIAASEPTAAPDPVPVAYSDPQPVAFAPPEPSAEETESSPSTDDQTSASAQPRPAPETPEGPEAGREPSAQLAPPARPDTPAPEAAPPPVVEPETVEPVANLVPPPDPVVHPDPVVQERPAETAGPAGIEPVAPVEEEESLGPLPDYVVDPNAPPPVRPVAAAPEPLSPGPAGLAPADEGLSDPNKPDLSGLGIRPVNFDLRRTEPERASAPKRPRPEATPPADDAKDRRSRSTGEPGDELEDVDWMGGLSTRLSAYSLAQDEELPQSSDDDEPEDAD